MNKPGRPKIALVLGAGSARGLSHIGVLQVLEENKIPFDFIVGCSIGAMIGGIYACSIDINMLGRVVEHIDPGVFFDVRVPRMGLISGKKIDELLRLLTKNKTFNDTCMPLYMLATDLLSSRGIVLKEGTVAEAIRASISIPGVFTPVKRDDMLLVDGAVTARLPVETARKLGSDIIIAVDVTFGEGKEVKVTNVFDVIMTSLDIMEKQQFDVISDFADVMIQPAVGGYSSADFDKGHELIKLGREAAEEKLPELIAKVRLIKTKSLE